MSDERKVVERVSAPCEVCECVVTHADSRTKVEFVSLGSGRYVCSDCANHLYYVLHGY